MGRAGREGLLEPKLLVQMGRECILLEEGIEDLDEPSLFCGEGFGQAEAGRHLIPLERRISIANCLFETREYNTLCMKFRRKVWDGDGDFISMEEIVRRQPYEAAQTPL